MTKQSSIGQFAAGTVEITLGGETFTARKTDLEAVAEVEAEARGRRVDMFVRAAMANKMPAEEMAKIIDKLAIEEIDPAVALEMRAKIDRGEEIPVAIDTKTIIYTLWFALKDNYPDMTREKVGQLVMPDKMEEVVVALAKLSPVNPIGAGPSKGPKQK